MANPRDDYAEYMRKKLGLKRSTQIPFTDEPTRPDVLRKIEIGSGRPVPGNKGGAVPLTSSTPKSTFDISKVKSVVDGIAPYVSNIANSFRKPPKPKLPNFISPAGVEAPSLDAERKDIDRSVRGINRGVDETLDANAAAAVKTGSLIQGLRAKGESYANEAKLKVDARNKTAQNVMQADYINSGKMDQYGENQIGRQIAIQREQSENLSNAADKYVNEQTRKGQEQLELKKFGIMSKMYGSGVLDRLVRGTLKKGEKDELTDDDYSEVLGIRRMNGGKLRYAVGGELPGPGDPESPIVMAQRLAKKHGHNNWRNVHTGGVTPPIVDQAGNPVTGPALKPSVPLQTFIPPEVTELSYDPKVSAASYIDPKSGDVMYTDQANLRLPRFQSHKIPGSDQMATKELKRQFNKRSLETVKISFDYGGYIGGGIGRSKTRKLRSIR